MSSNQNKKDKPSIDDIVDIISSNVSKSSLDMPPVNDEQYPPESANVIPKETHEMSPTGSRVWRWYDYSIIFFLLAAGFCGTFFTAGDYGLSWDEAYYYGPSKDAAEWLSRMTFNKEIHSAKENSDLWDDIWELPSVVKFANGVSYTLFSNMLGDLKALRIPSNLAFGLTLLFIYLVVFSEYGRAPALFGALCFAFMPRIFAHAHISAAETISSLIFFLTVLAFRKGISGKWWSIIFGILFGISLATKINAIFLPGIFLLWGFFYYRKESVNNIYSMFFITPIVMILIWPWLWPDIFGRFVAYLAFYAKHQFTALYFFGTKYNYGSTLAPVYYPLVITALTVPALFIPFILIGIGKTCIKIKEAEFESLILLGVLIPLLIASLPSSPKYDGVRLFIQIFPFLAVLAGIGFGIIIHAFPDYVNMKTRFSRREIVIVVLLLLTSGYGLFNILRYHPFEMSYFNEIIGGIEGANNQGLELTYWGESVNKKVIDDINQTLPENAKLKPLALNEDVFKIYQDWGLLRSDIILNAQPPYDYHILLNRKGFFTRPEWTLYQKWSPEKWYGLKEIPLLMLYKTGPEFEKEWPDTIPPGAIQKQ